MRQKGGRGSTTTDETSKTPCVQSTYVNTALRGRHEQLNTRNQIIGTRLTCHKL